MVRAKPLFKPIDTGCCLCAFYDCNGNGWKSQCPVRGVWCRSTIPKASQIICYLHESTFKAPQQQQRYKKKQEKARTRIRTTNANNRTNHFIQLHPFLCLSQLSAAFDASIHHEWGESAVLGFDSANGDVSKLPWRSFEMSEIYIPRGS